MEALLGKSAHAVLGMRSESYWCTGLHGSLGSPFCSPLVTMPPFLCVNSCKGFHSQPWQMWGFLWTLGRKPQPGGLLFPPFLLYDYSHWKKKSLSAEMQNDVIFCFTSHGWEMSPEKLPFATGVCIWYSPWDYCGSKESFYSHFCSATSFSCSMN